MKNARELLVLINDAFPVAPPKRHALTLDENGTLVLSVVLVDNDGHTTWLHFDLGEEDMHRDADEIFVDCMKLFDGEQRKGG